MNEIKTPTDFIRMKMLDSDMTIQELVKKTGLSYISIKKILEGETKTIRPQTIKTIMEKLDIPFSEIERLY